MIKVGDNGLNLWKNLFILYHKYLTTATIMLIYKYTLYAYH